MIKPREPIAKYIAEWFADQGLGALETVTRNRIAELITCKGISIVLEAWEFVYGQGKQSSRRDMEEYLEKELGLKSSSVNFE